MRASENHHLLLTLFFGVMMSALGLAALYMAVTQRNALALTTALPSLVTGFLGLHNGASNVAASPNTMAYGTPPPAAQAPAAQAPAVQPVPVPPPPAAPTHL